MPKSVLSETCFLFQSTNSKSTVESAYIQTLHDAILKPSKLLQKGFESSGVEVIQCELMPKSTPKVLSETCFLL